MIPFVHIFNTKIVHIYSVYLLARLSKKVRSKFLYVQFHSRNYSSNSHFQLGYRYSQRLTILIQYAYVTFEHECILTRKRGIHNAISR